MPYIYLNDYHRTTTSEIGDRPGDRTENYDSMRELRDTDIGEQENLANSSSMPQSFAFLYTRESDKIGSKVRKDGVDTKLQMTLSHTRRGINRTQAFSSQGGMISSIESIPQTADELLLSYKQGTKIQDPRFTTSSNEYGQSSHQRLEILVSLLLLLNLNSNFLKIISPYQSYLKPFQ